MALGKWLDRFLKWTRSKKCFACGHSMRKHSDFQCNAKGCYCSRRLFVVPD